MSVSRVPGETSEECEVTARPWKMGRVLMSGYYCLQFIGPINRQYIEDK